MIMVSVSRISLVRQNLKIDILEKDIIIRAWNVQNKMEPSISHKTWSEHRQVISSKFSEEF